MDRIDFGEDVFYIGDDDNRLAEITFVPSGKDKLIVDYTFVMPEMRGQGVGGLLVQCVVEHARETNKKIIAQCPFVKTKLEETLEYKEVLKHKKTPMLCRNNRENNRPIYFS